MFHSGMTQMWLSWIPHAVKVFGGADGHFRVPSTLIPLTHQLKPYTPRPSSVALILKETGDTYEIIENPLAKAEPRILKKSDVDGKPTKSMVSMMPKGLLDKLTQNEILDLTAYVWAKADPKHRYFQGGQDHGGHGHK